MRISVSPQDMFRILAKDVKQEMTDMAAVMQIKEGHPQKILVTPLKDPVKYTLVVRENGSWEAFMEIGE